MSRKNHKNKSNEERRGFFGRIFSSLKKKGDKQRMMQELLDIQRTMSENLSSFFSVKSELFEGLHNTSTKVDKFNRCLNEFLSERNNKDILDDLRNQVHNSRREERSFNEEIRRITERLHQREIEICKLEAENKELHKETERKEDKLKQAEEYIEKSNVTIELMKEEKMDLRLQNQKQENVIYELKSNSIYTNVTTEKLSENIKELESRIRDLKEEKIKVMEYSAGKCQMYEEKLKVAWVKFNSLRQERDALIEHTESVKNRLYNARESTTASANETKVLQLELKLYRRDRLIEMLADKLKIYEPEFSLLSDPNLLIYLDQDWYQLAVDSGSEQESEVSSVPSSTQSSSMASEAEAQGLRI